MWLRLLALATAIGMFVVLVMGAAVTNTGSAEGCGRSWPLCNGQFVPEFTVSTAIEYSHRAVTGVESVLVVALSVALLGGWRRSRQAQVLAPLMVGALVLQAGLGAAAVLWPQSPAVLASHFGVSLVAFAATALSAVFVFEQTRAPGRSELNTEAPNAAAEVPAAFRRAVLGVGVYLLLVVYLGAYVRHAGLSLACADWPLCHGQLVPALDGVAGVVFAHRLAALGAVVLLGWLAVRAWRLRIAQRTAGAAVGLCAVQALSGALVVWTQLGLFSTLAHAGIMALVFAAYAAIVRRCLATPGRQAQVVPRPRRSGAAVLS